MALSDNLIAFWELEAASGTRNDSHSTNHLSDNNTVAQGTGKVGNCADFEAANSEWLSIADNAALSCGNIDFTFTAWVNLESKSADGTIVCKGTNSGSGEFYFLYRQSADRFEFQVFGSAGFTNGTEVRANNLGSPATGTWYFIVAWHDSVANTLNIQVNNGTADSVAHTFGGHDAAGIFQMGGGYPHAPTPSEFFDGRIDQVGFWKRVLTADERTALYNSGNGLSYAAMTASQATQVSDTVTFTEGLSGEASKTPLAETFVLSETLGGKKTTGTQPKETVGLSESLSAQKIPGGTGPVTLPVADTAVLTETLRKQAQRTISENPTFAETLRVLISRLVAETPTFTESVSGARPSATVGDTVTFTESVLREARKVINESPVFTETLNFSVSRTIAETPVFTETDQPGRTISETVSLSESLTPIRKEIDVGSMAEPLAMNEVIVRVVTRLIAESPVFSESLDYGFFRSLTDTPEFTEALTTLRIAAQVVPEPVVPAPTGWIDTHLDYIKGYDDPNIMGSRPYGATVWAVEGEAPSSWEDNELHKISTYGGNVTMGGRPYGGTKWTDTE